MKKRLKRRFILISMFSFMTVVILLLTAINGVVIHSYHQTLDDSLNLLKENNGEMPFPNAQQPREINRFLFFLPTMRIANRYITVIYDGSEVEQYITDSFNIVSEEQGIQLAEEIQSLQKTNGWYQHYRYEVMQSEGLTYVMFIDGSFVQYITQSLIYVSLIIFLITSLLVLIVIVMISPKAIKPLIEAHEKQYQFMTDAGHELKTPLTIMNANASILELEQGSNEWIEGIQKQVNQMSELINRIILQSSLDEAHSIINPSLIHLSSQLLDIMDSYKGEIKKKKLKLTQRIDQEIICKGDIHMMNELIHILIDNAVKYSPDEGELHIELRKDRKIYLTIDNTYEHIDEVMLNKLFDRFYRVDSARTDRKSHGLGLSIATSIVEKHHGKISAIALNHHTIRFMVELN